MISDVAMCSRCFGIFNGAHSLSCLRFVSKTLGLVRPLKNSRNSAKITLWLFPLSRFIFRWEKRCKNEKCASLDATKLCLHRLLSGQTASRICFLNSPLIHLKNLSKISFLNKMNPYPKFFLRFISHWHVS